MLNKTVKSLTIKPSIPTPLSVKLNSFMFLLNNIGNITPPC